MNVSVDEYDLSLYLMQHRILKDFECTSVNKSTDSDDVHVSKSCNGHYHKMYSVMLHSHRSLNLQYVNNYNEVIYMLKEIG